MTEALKARPKAKERADAGLVFLTARGRRWVRESANGFTQGVSVAFARLAKAVEVHRPGVYFYSLRHTFRTVADASRDPVAVDLVMGHADHTMGAVYRERLDGSRLTAVAEYVRAWLFGAAPSRTPRYGATVLRSEQDPANPGASPTPAAVAGVAPDATDGAEGGEA